MCKINSEIHFCTCASVKQIPLSIDVDGKPGLAEYKKTHYIWTLSRYVSEKDSGILGEIVMPAESLGEDLTSEYLQAELNSKNCFDFEYFPSEGDNLEIREKYFYKNIKGNPRPDLYDYMSFIFKKGRWEEDHYNFFTDKLRQLKKGIVQFLN